MNEKTLIEKLSNANKCYRDGNPIMSDEDYDKLSEQLPEDHWYRNIVESETINSDTFVHPIPMLSTQKAKTDEEINKWIAKVKRYYNGIINIRITAKLDGMAAKFYKTGELVTRGNGNKGNIVTSAFSKGVINTTDEFGLGELVMEKQYFEDNLKDDFSHPRSVVVGIVMSDTVNPKVQKALDSNAVHFAHYDSIFSITTSISDFSRNYRKIEEQVRNNTPYPIDGVIIEVIDPDIKRLMGSTEHHNNWQIALKPKDEEAITKVLSISAQTGRTGKVTPVLNVEATELDGSIIRRVTAHNFKNIIDKKIGINSKIGIVRSGGVIPKIETVIKESGNVVIPRICNSCGEAIHWNKNQTDLMCSNIFCPAKIETKLIHFFNTIENVDGFGPSTIEKIVSNGYEKISEVYDLSEEDYIFFGFGEKTAYNLITEINRSMNTEIEDWRFLAAFGVRI